MKLGGEIVEFDYSKLKGKIIEKYGTQTEFAKEFGVSKNSFSMKMNNKTSFSTNDILKITNMLNIDKEDISSYFFTQKV